jgi:hypothetical protein
MPPIGSGVHVGTHSSKGLYSGDGDVSAQPVLTISAPTYTVSRTNSPFGRLLINTRLIRSSAPRPSAPSIYKILQICCSI